MSNTTFISLTNQLLRRVNEVEITESDFPSTRGVQSMAKDAINASIEQIMQTEATWPFVGTTGSQLLVVGQEQYSWPTTLKEVNWQSFHISHSTDLNIQSKALEYINRNSYHRYLKDLDDDAGDNGTSVPQFVFPNYTGGFGVSPSPDKAYTVTFDYWQNNTALVLFGDTSLIPTNYDEVIIQGGIYHFYMFRDNTEMSDRADARFRKQLTSMKSILIHDKIDRIRGSLVTRRKSRGATSIPVDGWYM